MTVLECYEAMQGDYNDVMNRLPREESVKKFLGKFLGAQDYNNLMTALEAKDWEAAFRASHTMKGVTANLSISKLSASVAELCETMRGGAPKEDITGLIETVKDDYAVTVAAIHKLLEEG